MLTSGHGEGFNTRKELQCPNWYRPPLPRNSAARRRQEQNPQEDPKGEYQTESRGLRAHVSCICNFSLNVWSEFFDIYCSDIKILLTIHHFYSKPSQDVLQGWRRGRDGFLSKQITEIGNNRRLVTVYTPCEPFTVLTTFLTTWNFLMHIWLYIYYQVSLITKNFDVNILTPFNH